MIENFFQPLSTKFPKTSKTLGSIGASVAKSKDIADDAVVIFSIGDEFVEVRKSFYQLGNHFTNTVIVDLGMFRSTTSHKNNQAGLKEVLYYLYEKRAKVLILSSDSNVALAQWQVEREFQTPVDAAMVVRSFDSPCADYLFEYWKQQDEKDHLFHLSIIGFQSYFNTMTSYDELNQVFYDNMRLGEFRANPHAVETLLRESDFACFDLNSLKFSDFTAQTNPCPNGFYSEEACLISRYAGISNKLNTFSLLESNPKQLKGTNAALLAQMMWYFVDGVENRYHDIPDPKNTNFHLIHCPLENSPIPEILFIRSLVSNRLWMQVPLGKNTRWTGCTEEEFSIASQGEIPEKWFRAIGF